MPLARPTFHAAENTGDTNSMIHQVFKLVQSIDSKVGVVRAQQDLLKERLDIQEGQLKEIVLCVRGADYQLKRTLDNCEVLRREVADTNSKMKTMDDKLDNLRIDCKALKTQVEKNTRKVTSAVNRKDDPKAAPLTAPPPNASYVNTVLTLVKPHRVTGCMTTECAKQHQPESRKLVQAFIKNRDWVMLKRGLEGVLDRYSEAYNQLQDAESLCGVGYHGYTQLASLLLCAGLPVDTTDSTGDNMLLGAAQEGQAKLVKHLLDRGANVNVRGHYDFTPLMRAAHNNQLAVVKSLVQAGADTTVRNKSGVTALYLATSRGHMAVAQYLEQLPH